MCLCCGDERRVVLLLSYLVKSRKSILYHASLQVNGGTSMLQIPQGTESIQ